jgi:hypothetical protein
VAIVHTGEYALKVLDQTLETQEHTIYTPVLTSANIVAQRALQATYQTAVDGVVIGVIIKSTTTADVATEDAPVPPVDGSAQREMEWLVIYEDAVTFAIDKIRIGTPDLNPSLRRPNQQIADLTNAAWVAYKAAFEAAAKSRLGNPVSIVSIILTAADT